MDDPIILWKEYIRLEEEKARRRGKVYNWETSTYDITSDRSLTSFDTSNECLRRATGALEERAVVRLITFGIGRETLGNRDDVRQNTISTILSKRTRELARLEYSILTQRHSVHRGEIYHRGVEYTI
ncbi:hypothetical protein Tco_0660888 [Tanacetum coccineum]